MKNILRFKTVVVLAIITIILSISTISNAYSVMGSLSSNDKLVAGKNVTVTLSLSDIDADSGVTSITVDKIDYDTSVFETITASNFTGSNGWNPNYSTTSQGLTLVNNTHIKENGAVLTLTLKVKDAINVTSSTIKFEGIIASAGLTTGDIEVGTKTLTINVDKTADSGSENTPTTTGSQSTNNNGATSNNGTVKSSDDTKSTSKKSTTPVSTTSNLNKLPKTGVGTGIILLVTVGAIIGIIFYIKYKNIKKYEK